MKTLKPLLLLAASLLLGEGIASAQAQAGDPIIYVSGVGDDVNPGSRTAPAKTFAGALSKVVDGGEINILDPGGFGTVTINKSVTIDGIGFESSILSTGQPNGVNIANPSTATAPLVVTLRNIRINGTGTGTTGVRVSGLVHLRLVNCDIWRMAGVGVNFGASAGSKLSIENCRIHECVGGGVLLAPPVNNSVTDNTTAQLDRVSIANCGSFGVSAQAGATAYANEVECRSSTAGPAFLSATNSRLAISKSLATSSSSGITAGGAVFLTDSQIVSNTGAGLSVTTGSITSTRTNRIANNSPDGAPTTTVGLK